MEEFDKKKSPDYTTHLLNTEAPIEGKNIRMFRLRNQQVIVYRTFREENKLSWYRI